MSENTKNVEQKEKIYRCEFTQSELDLLASGVRSEQNYGEYNIMHFDSDPYIHLSGKLYSIEAGIETVPTPYLVSYQLDGKSGLCTVIAMDEDEAKEFVEDILKHRSSNYTIEEVVEMKYEDMSFSEDP